MDKHRRAYHRMVDNAQKAFDTTRSEVIYDAVPIQQKRPNYISAIIWTSVVAAIICSVFLGFLLFLVNESNIEENLTRATTLAVSGLEQMVQQQNEEIKILRDENKKIYDYLKLWTPMHRRLPPGVKEVWKIPGYGVPRYELRSIEVCEEELLCSYFSE